VLEEQPQQVEAQIHQVVHHQLISVQLFQRLAVVMVAQEQ